MERCVYCIQAIRRQRDYSRKRRASSPKRAVSTFETVVSGSAATPSFRRTMTMVPTVQLLRAVERPLPRRIPRPSRNDDICAAQTSIRASSQAVRGKLKPGSWADAILDAVDRGEVDQAVCPVMMIDYVGPSLDTTIYAIGNGVW